MAGLVGHTVTSSNCRTFIHFVRSTRSFGCLVVWSLGRLVAWSLFMLVSYHHFNALVSARSGYCKWQVDMSNFGQLLLLRLFVVFIWKLTVAHNCVVALRLCDCVIRKHSNACTRTHTHTLAFALRAIISKRVKAILICKGFWVSHEWNTRNRQWPFFTDGCAVGKCLTFRRGPKEQFM